MNASTAQRPPDPLAVFLAGLQAGMIAVCWMLAWLGLGAMTQRRTFWTAENLIATVFHGDLAIRRNFGATTFSGIALYLLVYSLLGATFAILMRGRFTGLGTVLLGVLCSLAWYALWFRVLGQTLMPLVWLLHAEKSTAFGHVLFGALIARFPVYLPWEGHDLESREMQDPHTAPQPIAPQPTETLPPDPGLS
ncbi:MAG: hypothetical protein ABI759_26425 [Candidatus Solibacter sp.]